MAKPDFFGDGSTPKIHDTLEIVWKKILGAKQDALGGGADTANDPKIHDTIQETKRKFERAVQ